MEPVHSVRKPAVAGSFYPADPDQLNAVVEQLLHRTSPCADTPKAIVAPHAGYLYSSKPAAAAMSRICHRDNSVSRVVILSPNHKMPVDGVAVPSHEYFATPLGKVPLDREVCDQMVSMPFCSLNDEAHAEEHGIEVLLPFMQRRLENFRIVPLIIGRLDTQSVSRLLHEIWGGPETIIIVSSDLSHYLSDAEARDMDGLTARSVERLNVENIKGNNACGWVPFSGLLEQAKLRDLRVTRHALCNSSDTVGPKEKVVGYGAWSFEYASSARTDSGTQQVLHHLAKRSLVEGGHGGEVPKIDHRTLPVSLTTERANFVTVYVDGKFRGCRGSIVPHRPWGDDVVQNTFNSAFHDPRVPALTREETHRAEIEISVLSHPRNISCSSIDTLIEQLNPDKDGVILDGEGKRSLFLPKVWSNLSDPREFVKQLLLKGGWPENHWSENMRAFRFSAELF